MYWFTKQRFQMIGSALSQLLNILTASDLSKTGPNESVSARSYRQGISNREAAINALFNDPNHCESAYLSDVKDAYALIDEHERRDT